MKKQTILLLALTLIVAQSFAKSKPSLPYKDSSLSVEKRVDDLLTRMTLEEKVAQMSQYVGIEHIRQTEKKFKGIISKNDDANGFYKNLSINQLEEMTSKGLVGSYLHVVTPEEANYLQGLAMKSRLQIPLIIGIDAIHGNALCSGATVYPTPIGQAASFSPELVRRSSEETATEMRKSGSHWAFTPNLDVARDARWGRVGETFGEDPFLVARMGVATILGLQGDQFSGKDRVLACAKHLIAGSEPSNGTNAAPMDVSEATLREVFLPPYKAAVKEAKVFSIMTAHNELNGIPCHANDWLMNKLMREEYGFKGFVVSDWMDIERIFDLHHYVPTMNDAFIETINTGMDMHMHGPEFYFSVIELVKSGKLSESRIDESCRRILESKFRLGIFENPYIDVEEANRTFYSKEHQATALEMAEKSIVLLKNSNLLPLDFSKYKNILVTGPNANSDAILGDWTLRQPADKVITILEGIQEQVSAKNLTFYDYGTSVKSNDQNKVAEAANLAKKSDLAIVVVGENPLRYMNGEKTSGENIDRMSLDLLGTQEELVKQICATGVPTIVILVGGRPLSVNWIAENAQALIQAWEPGSFGGRAVANILSGKVNPSAKLPITMPRSAGQIQMIYNHKPSQYFHKYIDGPSTPLYPFGYGLSYSTFEYSDLQLSKNKFSTSDSITATVNLTNKSRVEGTEVVQLYIRDLYSAPTRPIKELKDFARITLKPGESKRVSFTITPEKLAYYNKAMKYVVEAGDFEIMMGSSSQDSDLLKKTVSVY